MIRGAENSETSGRVQVISARPSQRPGRSARVLSMQGGGDGNADGDDDDGDDNGEGEGDHEEQ